MQKQGEEENAGPGFDTIPLVVQWVDNGGSFRIPLLKVKPARYKKCGEWGKRGIFVNCPHPSLATHLMHLFPLQWNNSPKNRGGGIDRKFLTRRIPFFLSLQSNQHPRPRTQRRSPPLIYSFFLSTLFPRPFPGMQGVVGHTILQWYPKRRALI